MARKQTHIISKLKAFLNKNYAKGKVCKDIIQCQQGILQIPDRVLITQVIGKAEFDKSFYHYIISKNFIHPESQSRLYRLLIKNKSHIIEIIEKANALKYFTIKHENQQDYEQCCFSCYCIIIGISKNQNNPLSDALTYGYFKHFLPTLFPKTDNSKDIKYLNQQIIHNLKKRWNKTITLKESYQIDQNAEEDAVNFKLIAKLKDYQDTELIHQQGKRLKPTRLKAYQELLQQLNNSYYHFPHPKKI